MYLDFNRISQEIPFNILLDDLNIAYASDGKNFKGKVKDTFFIIDIAQNKFFTPPDNEFFGSVINFLAWFSNTDLRSAATELNAKYLLKPKEPKRDLPNLTLNYHPFLETYGISQELASKYEVGLPKQKCIFNGKICFKIYDHDESLSGYVAFDHKDGKWHFPQNFKRPLYNLSNIESDYVVVVANPFDCVKLSQFEPNIVSLLGVSMTEYQYFELRKFKRVLLIVKDPQNLVNRLYPFTFVQAPFLIKPISDYNSPDIADLLRK